MCVCMYIYIYIYTYICIYAYWIILVCHYNLFTCHKGIVVEMGVIWSLSVKHGFDLIHDLYFIFTTCDILNPP